MSAPHYVPVATARSAGGLRLVLGKGLPGPWSIAARAIFDVKGIDYIAVAHEAGMANQEIVDWTGHASAPIAIFENERARSGWAEILVLAESLKADPPLIPAAAELRVEMFGLSHEICGEEGFGWSVRAIMFAGQRASGSVPYPTLLDKYSTHQTVEHHVARVNSILHMLSARLARQAAAGSPYLVGDRLSAADLYWTAFSNMLDSMPESACVMPDFYRQLPGLLKPHLLQPVDPALVRHRAHILEHHLECPLEL